MYLVYIKIFKKSRPKWRTSVAAHEFASIKKGRKRRKFLETLVSGHLANLALQAAASDIAWVTEKHRPFLVTSTPILVQRFSTRMNHKNNKTNFQVVICIMFRTEMNQVVFRTKQSYRWIFLSMFHENCAMKKPWILKIKSGCSQPPKRKLDKYQRSRLESCTVTSTWGEAGS
jgi:hypothetical protein